MMFSAILKITNSDYPANSSCPDLTKIHPPLIANSLIERRKTHYLKSALHIGKLCTCSKGSSIHSRKADISASEPEV
jgi:hypothetical protein